LNDVNVLILNAFALYISLALLFTYCINIRRVFLNFNDIARKKSERENENYTTEWDASGCPGAIVRAEAPRRAQELKSWLAFV
jgi:hypothetical protein